MTTVFLCVLQLFSFLEQFVERYIIAVISDILVNAECAVSYSISGL